MINTPITIIQESFQKAWLEVVMLLIRSHWELRNLVVQIKNPGLIDADFNKRVDEFAKIQNLLPSKHVAYTIFPHGLYRHGKNADAVFKKYNRENGLYDRLHHRSRDWGTYFRRMTNYETRNGPVNQVGNIINAIKNRDKISKAAYTIIIQNPGGETIRPLGGPCLNYMAIQAEPGEPIGLGLLAVYRNHDFLERAYGNYWGLCNLLAFIVREIGGTICPLTCISSHAFIANKKNALKIFVEGI
jgi:hypothetical protein